MVTYELIHFLITSILAILVWVRYRDWRLAPVCFIFGFFIDGDHWFDFFFFYGPEIDIGKFFNSNYIELLGRVFVSFHGWEFVPLLWLTGKKLGERLKTNGLEWTITLAYFVHLLFDDISFSDNPFG
jgi:hypothetical protein